MEKVPNGRLYPPEVIEGSVVTLVCNKDYRTAGNWQFKCEDGVVGTETKRARDVTIKTRDVTTTTRDVTTTTRDVTITTRDVTIATRGTPTDGSSLCVPIQEGQARHWIIFVQTIVPFILNQELKY